MAARRAVVLLLVIVGACASPSPDLAVRPRIVIREFALADRLQVIRLDGAPRPDTGLVIAEAISADLTRRKRDAVTLPRDRSSQIDADLIVAGQVTKLHAGRGALLAASIPMWAFCWPCAIPMRRAGMSEVTVEGTITRRDGTILEAFTLQARGGNLLDENGLRSAGIRIARQVAPIIERVEYAAMLPGSEPSPVVAPATAPAPDASAAGAAAQRLEVLESLRARGLVTDDEYRQKRKDILDDL